ncbi:sigma-54 interaction domain-containing protein [Sporosarcina sp. CAU 1771]
MKLENHLLSILESLHDAVIVILNDSTIVFINKAYTDQFGVPAEKIINKKMSDIEPDSRILEVLKDGAKRINDYSYVHSLQKHVRANITPLLEKGQMIGVVTIMQDISEITSLQIELSKYKDYSMQLQKQLDSKNYSRLKTSVPEMQNAVDMTKNIAKTDATVVLYGESGVGKEVFAKAIHESSARFNKPFIPINMASIPEALFESEMFGYTEGSFTGSRKGGKKGILEMANGGTLLLDEIGDMSLNNQAKLLRVIQERQFNKIGGTKLTSIDVRLICATNANLRKKIDEGTFREDLYYRINVVPITIPPLRNRKEDIKSLSEVILNDIMPRYNKQVTIEDEAFEVMKRYSWPGNVRELFNVLERMVAFSDKVHLGVEDLPDSIQYNAEVPIETFDQNTLPTYKKETSLKLVIERKEKEIIQYVMETSDNRSEAIERLGISRKTFYEKIKKYDLF